MNNQQINEQQKGNSPSNDRSDILLWIMAGLAGGIAAYFGVQYWLPNLSASVLGQDQQFYWFLSRATAIVAYLLLWLNMTLGVGITSKLANVFPGGAVSADLHQYLSILGLGFAAFHGLILIGDPYLHYSLVQLLVPFGSAIYRPFWVGLGQMALYMWGFVYLSTLIKKQIGRRTWRFVHYFSFIVFGGTLLHGIMAGTDSGTPWMNALYWSTGSIFMSALFYRIVTSKQPRPAVKEKTQEYTIPRMNR